MKTIVNDQREIPSVRRYPRLLRGLHWLIAALVLFTWPMGLMIDFVKNEVKLDFYLVHESFGFVVLWLMLLRVGARLLGDIPPVEAPAAQAMVANLVHRLLYLFLLVMPVSGFLATNAHGFPLKWFGLFEVWSPIGKMPDIAFTLSAIHEWSAWILLGLVALHVAAALYHHVIRRDATLFRML